MSVANIDIGPSAGLIESTPDSTVKQTRFGLFTTEWIQMQSYVAAAVEMPIGQGNFTEKYGAFDDSSLITGCVDAMKNVQATASEFGDPKSLKKQLTANPALLASDEAPKEIYTHTVWLGQRVNQTAFKIQSGYQSVLDEVSGLPSQSQVDAIKAYLFDATLGPIPLSITMAAQVGDLVKKLGKFEEKMAAYNDTMQKFVNSSGQMMTTLDNTLGTLAKQIDKLKTDRDAAYDAWVKWTIAAVVASVGVAIIGGLLAPFSFGASVAVGATAGAAVGIGLGIKASTYMAKYNEYCKELKAKEKDLKQKNLLKGDLTGFSTQMGIVGPAMTKFMGSLASVQGVFAKMTADMTQLSNDITPQNVGTISFLVKSKANLAIDVWKQVGTAAGDFTVDSLINIQGSIPFGTEFPEKAAG